MKKLRFPFLPTFKFESRITIVYGLIGLLWIIFSDILFGSIILEKKLLVGFSIFKGVVYVVITSLLLYYFLKRHMQKLRTAEWLARQKNKEISEQYEDNKKLLVDLERAKNEAEESETFLNNIFENIPNMIFLKDAENLRYVRFNKAGEEIVGYSRDHIIGKCDYDIFSKEEADFFTAKDKEVFNAEKHVVIEEERLNTINGIRILYTKKIAIKDKAGNSRYLLGISEDITEKIESREELLKAREKVEENEKMFSAITNQASEGIALTDIDGRYIFANPAFCKMTGYTESELLQMTVFDLKADIKAPGIFNKEAIVPEGVTNEIVLKRKDGTEFFTEIVTGTVQISNQRFYLGIVRDITDRKSAEEAIFEGQQVFRTLVENSPDIIARYNLECKRTYVNPQYLTVAQLPHNTLLETAPVQFSPLPENSAQALQSLLRRVLDSGKAEAIDVIWPKADNKDYWYNIYAFPEFDRQGKVASVMTISRDITNRKMAEIKLQEKNSEYLLLNRELIQAKEQAEESERLKTAFLQNISHEIRTPMNAIIGFSGLVSDQSLMPEKRQYLTSIIQKSAHQLLNIVTNILTLSTLETKQEKLNVSHVNVYNILNDLKNRFKPQADSQQIRLETRFNRIDSKMYIYSDGQKITQILSNLLLNALKFTSEGSVEMGCEQKGNELEFYVKDTGIGIRKEWQTMIFERFRQADNKIHVDYGGTGLGLTISKGFVELLGGKIWVDSEPGKGSTFYFTIPFHPVDSDEVAQGQDENPPEKVTTQTLLVAEDDDINYLVIKEYLSDMDVMFLHACDGFEVIDICQRHPEIGLILMDIKMPNMDGYTAALKVKEFRPDMKIIAQTAYALDHEREKYKGPAFDDYLTKPLNKEDFTNVILKYIQKH